MKISNLFFSSSLLILFMMCGCGGDSAPRRYSSLNVELLVSSQEIGVPGEFTLEIKVRSDAMVKFNHNTDPHEWLFFDGFKNSEIRGTRTSAPMVSLIGKEVGLDYLVKAHVIESRGKVFIDLGRFGKAEVLGDEFYLMGQVAPVVEEIGSYDSLDYGMSNAVKLDLVTTGT